MGSQLTNDRAHLVGVNLTIHILRVDRIGHGEIVEQQNSQAVAKIIEIIQLPCIATPEADDVDIRVACQAEHPLVTLAGMGEVQRLV